MKSSKSKFDKIKRTIKRQLHSSCKLQNAMLSEEFNTSLLRERNLTKDYLHEVKSSHTHLRRAIKTLEKAYKENDSDLIYKTFLSIRSLIDLNQNRTELFEYELNPELFDNMASQGVSIYKEIEKLYKSINEGWNRKIIRLNGVSYSRYKTKRIISIGLYILLDNAHKYTPSDERVEIDFNEIDETLYLTISNLGPHLSPEEQASLCNRDFRGCLARQLFPHHGKGLGLNIAKRIFASCDVKFEIKPSFTIEKIINGHPYSKFTTVLTFSPIILNV